VGQVALDQTWRKRRQIFRPTEDSKIPTMTLHREPGIVADHVACVGKSAYAEGQSDLVLSLDIDIPEDAGPMTAITHIKLKRSHPVGINDTNDQNSLLGVSLQPDGPLLNHPNGRIQLRNPASIKRVWLFACTDGQDQPDNIYWAEVRLRRDMPQVI